jgi:hypothetical protein
MAQIPDNLLPASWHKYFAMEANNAAWDLSEGSENVMGNTALLDAAHASAWHWRVAGTELHHMRSVMLLALVHARLGMGICAWAYAEQMKNYFTAKPDTPDWEIAFVHVIHALAAQAHGQAEAFQRSYASAVASLDAIQDPEDRNVVVKTFNLLPQA